MLKMSKIDQIHLRAVMLCMAKMSKMGKNIQTHFYHNFLNMVSFECNAIYVEDVEDRSNIPKGYNAMYVGDVEDVEDKSNTPEGCNAMYVEDVKDRSNTPKGCNAMYVEDVEDRSNTPKGCNAMYVEDVKDRSNTPKGCNAMYVEDVKDGKRTYTHILAHNFLNT